MRKLLFKCLLLMTASNVFPHLAFAQRNEIAVSANLGNATIISNGVVEDFLVQNEFTTKSFSPSFFVTFKHYFPNDLGLGITGGVFFDKGDYAARDEGDSYNIGTYTRTSYIIAPELEIPYYVEHGLKLYMIVALGARFSNAEISYYPNVYAPYTHPQPNVIIPALQYTPIGVRFGTRIGGFAELGWGYKGILNLGFFFKF